MSTKPPPGMPLTKEELVRLKYQIEPTDYLVVQSGHEKILAIRSSREFPDIVNDLECMINKLDIRDANELNHALIIGDEEVIGVPLDAIDSLISRRMEEDERIATDLGEKLIEPYTTLLFESEHDPFKTLRLGIRVEGNLKDFKPQQLPDILFSKIKSLPRHSEVIYLIADDGYIRISGLEFYRRLREFLRENPNKNRELAKEFIYMTRGKLADYFIDKCSDEDLFLTGRQEDITNFIPEDEPEESVPKEKTEVGEGISVLKPEESQKSQVPRETLKMAETGEPRKTGETKELKEMVPREEKTKVSKPFKPAPSGTPGKYDDLVEDGEGLKKTEPIDETTDTIEPNSSSTVFEQELIKSEQPRKLYPTTASFLIQLQDKLSKSGFEIIRGVEIPGVDLVADNPESMIQRVFFSYMPKFNLRKALDLEHSINRFSPELTIVISRMDDPELNVFIVGKNILPTNIDTILHTDLLTRLEERI